MKTAKMETKWKQTNPRAEISPVARTLNTSEPRIDQSLYTRDLSQTNQVLRCPHCDSIIYSRRNKLCGLCNQVLPPELLFSAVESDRIESLLTQERQRHKRWMVRVSNAH